MASPLAKLLVPTVFIAGVPAGVSARSRQLLGLAQIPLQDIVPSGHWPFIDQTEDFVSLLADFLKNTP